MRITLMQIEAFYWTARLGGVHAASRHLHLTQPAVSARIKEMESLLSVKLFDRSKQRMSLTASTGACAWARTNVRRWSG